MKKNVTWSMVLAISMLVLSSCKKDEKDPETPAATTGNLDMLIEHKWGNAGANFMLGQDLIHPMSGDTLNYSTFKYYVSNLKLKKSDGTWWVQPESYFLVDLSKPSSTTLKLTGVPTGNYVAFSYTLGVDSTRNVSGSQSGALSTTNGMFWSWNSGYIMCKAEGTSPQGGMGGSFTFHLGGFSGANNIVTVKEADLSATNLIVSATGTSQIHMIANPAKMFHNYGSISNGSMIHMPNANSTMLGTDFFGNVQFDHVHN